MDKLSYFRILALMGLLISGYLLYLYNTENTNICDVTNIWSCSTVSQSTYSKLFGVPVAFYGIVSFAVLLLLSIKPYIWMLFLLSSINLGFMAYLTFAEIFYIKALCFFCLIAAMIALVSFILAALIFREEMLK